MGRLTAEQGKAIAAILNSTVGSHTIGKKTVIITGVADDLTGRAGIRVCSDQGKELAFLGIDTKKLLCILNYGNGLGDVAMTTLQNENAENVLLSVKAKRISLASYVAWEIVTDDQLMNSLKIVHKGGLKTGQTIIKALEKEQFENAAIKALKNLDLKSDIVEAIDWLSKEIKDQLIPKYESCEITDDHLEYLRIG